MKIREALYWQECLMRLEGLTVYRAFLRDELIDIFCKLCRVMAYDPQMNDAISLYYEFASKLLIKADAWGLKGNLLRKYCIRFFLNDENLFTLACERNEPVLKSSLYQYAAKDVAVLQYLCGFDLQNLCDNVGSGEDLWHYVPVMDREDPYLEEVENAASSGQMLDALRWRYERMGAGDMAQYRMFRVDGQALIGLPHADRVEFSDIIGFEPQKALLKSNTEDFLAGRPANNILLAGSRGNGKSSCVKALVNKYADQRLRIIEIRKDQSAVLPELMQQLAKRGQYFIIFMDDLSFEHFETQYKHLKSLLEGGAETKPKNVLFYATSNRRHIIRESWGDRNEPSTDEDIHTTDTVHEKLSLFDRFGVTITFPNLTQEDYLRVTQGLANRRGLAVEPAFLSEQAMKWALAKSISGRTARQFIDHITGEITRV